MKLPFPNKGQCMTHTLEMIHSDMGGPVSLQSHDEKQSIRQFLEWADNVQAYFKTELDTIEFSANFQKFFQTNGGREYLNKVFSAKLKECRVMHLSTAPDTLKQNSLAE
ncbi:hypothetical protein M422DRAFT_168134 [Sphaerobolus stellatus SS14]|uniref:Uncharacterized protein n=1 Tax=Sphaerobolus stellatus (strain SS14) TaxID=990650 RepID=A0A0C9VZC8_SPHS4|nr:hypothetical protein M422DRAFT_168134 [Sphaerobolus stellatus SS14]